MNNNLATQLPTDAWGVVGWLVKARRERLGLNQEELRQRGGPAVSTVGKVERAAQESFPLRTQHALEKALGWPLGTIESLIRTVELEGSWWSDEAMRVDFIDSMIDDDVPDMSHKQDDSIRVTRAADLTDDELLAELTYRMKRYAVQEEGQAHGHSPAQKIDVQSGLPAVDGISVPIDGD